MTIANDPASRPRILLVEDDTSVRRSIQLLLQGQGFEVRAYAVGDSPVADGAASSVDCLVADYRLEGSDGLALLAALREAGMTAPAILVTAFPSAELRASAKEAGFVDLIEKPFREGALVNAVAHAIRRGAELAG